jgi:hypothetical protein
MTTTRAPALIGTAAALILLAGCTAGTATTTTPGPVVPATDTPAPVAPATDTPAPTSPAVTPAASTSSPIQTADRGWGTGPVTVSHTPSWPLPVLTRVRYAAHPGYDRIVFDISGDLPSYTARYVGEVRSDGSGERVVMPGRRFLLIVLNPAQSHRDDYTPTVSGVHRTDLRNLKAYAIAGDYEAYVSIALGLDDVAGYRIRELPGRIYVDVAS